MSGRSNDDLLCGFLAVAVMAAIDDLRWTDETIRLRMMRDLGYPDIAVKQDDPAAYYAELERLSSLPFGGYPLAGADSMMFGGQGCAQSFAAWAKALALLAYGYGGVTFGPLRWCALHMHQRWTQADGQVCPSCLREEEEARLTGEGERDAA
jgi:hypothetical protein